MALPNIRYCQLEGRLLTERGNRPHPPQDGIRDTVFEVAGSAAN